MLLTQHCISSLLSLNKMHSKKLAKEAAGTDGPYSVRVKVIRKTEVYRSLVNPALDYQLLTFEDGEGTKLKAVLFEDSLDEFEDVMEDQMDYDISNAKVRLIPGRDRDYPADEIYELHFNINTHVEPIFTLGKSNVPQYISLSAIPRFGSVNEQYDVVGVLIYVDQHCEETNTNGQNQAICELLIIDQSSQRIMIVTASQEKAIKEFRNLRSVSASYPVIGFTDLRISYRKGFSLATTHKTSINLSPTGEKASALRAWAEANTDLLTAKHSHIFGVRNPQADRIITTVEQLLQKKVTDTLHDERHWLRLKLNPSDPVLFNVYLGCVNCNTRSSKDMGVAYTCHVCYKPSVICSPRMSFTFEGADETGSHFFTALTENAEIMLGAAAAHLYTMLPQDRADYLEEAKRGLSNEWFYLKVAPAPCLIPTTDQSTMWMLEKIEQN